MHLERKNILKLFIFSFVLIVIFVVLFNLHRITDIPSSEELLKLSGGYYLKYGYSVILFAALIEGFLFVNWYFPGSIVLVFGVLSAKEYNMNIAVIISFITLGFLISSILNYAMGRFGWYHVFDKIGLKGPLEKIKTQVHKKGLIIIFSTYLHPNIGALTATSIGILKLPFKKFVLFSLLSLISWNCLWGFIAYISGPVILKFLGPSMFLTVILLWLLYSGIKILKQNMKRSHTIVQN